MAKGTKTASFGTTKREGHDSSSFYNRNLYKTKNFEKPVKKRRPRKAAHIPVSTPVPEGDWMDKIYCLSSEHMPIPDSSVALAFTSPPYNVGKDYDDNMTLDDYLSLIKKVGSEVYRVLKPGGRYVINIANLGRKPYIPLHARFYDIHDSIGFLPMGEIIWQKSKGASGNCAWGSWRNAKAPRLRDIHEYLLVFTKQEFSRTEKGENDISDTEFMQSTLSIWQLPPESARRVGHPAPFPAELAARVIRLYSYVNDVVLDPFAGSGSTCVAAVQNRRHYVGFDIAEKYCKLTRNRIAEALTIQQNIF